GSGGSGGCYPALGDGAYGMPARPQDAAGSLNRRMDAALKAVGITVSDEHRAGSAGGLGARLETAPPATYFHCSWCRIAAWESEFWV
ncbi:MAG: hypothetical protein ACOY40_04650, partial [Bacillota bacterium]